MRDVSDGVRYAFPVILVVSLTAACAGDGRDPSAQPVAERYDSLIPGTIGIAVASKGADVIVVAVRPGSAAERAGVRAGDRIRKCNGEPVESALEFERRVLDSRPGSLMQVELARDGELQRVSLPVEEILTAVLS